MPSPIQSLVPLSPRHFEILLALEGEPKHGYGIIQAVESGTGGSVELATSTLYASLRSLLREELVEEAEQADEPSAGPPRRYYRITARGRATLEAEALRVADLAARVRPLLARGGKS